MASEIRVNQLTNRAGLGTITFANGGVQFSGITTFANGEFYVGTGATIINPSSNEFNFHTGGSNRFTINNSGVNIPTLTATTLTATTGTFSGNVSVGGVLTYEDVKNVDAVGLVTARAGVHIPDNQKLLLGTNTGPNDGEIYSSGSHVYFQARTAGQTLRLTADDVYIRNRPDGQSMARFDADGAVDLFYNTSPKFSTTNTGIDVTGAVVADDIIITGTSVVADFKSTNNNYVMGLAGNNASVPVYLGTDSSGNFLLASGSGVTERLRIQADGNVGIARTVNNWNTSNTSSLYDLSINRESNNTTGGGLNKSLNVDNQYTVQTFRSTNTNRNGTQAWFDIAHFRAWDINAKVIIQSGGTFTGDQVEIKVISSYNSALNNNRSGPYLEVKSTQAHTARRFTKVKLGCNNSNRQPILQVYLDGNATHNANGYINVTVYDYGSAYGTNTHRGEPKFATATTLNETWKELSDRVIDVVNSVADHQHMIRDSFYHTNMWANIADGPGYFHQKHSHPNCFFSSIIYLRGSKVSSTVFYDPRSQTQIFAPDYSIYNSTNANIFNLPYVEGSIAIFPSWLPHAVLMGDLDDNSTRITITCNSMMHCEVNKETAYLKI